MRLPALLSSLALLVSCGPAYEVQSMSIPLDPPVAIIPPLDADGLPVTVADMRSAIGTLAIDVVNRKVTFTATGLAPLDTDLLTKKFAYRLWIRDAALTPTYLGDVDVDGVGRGTFKAIYGDVAPPLASAREGILVLWFNKSPTQVDPTFSTGSNLTGDLGQRRDGHSGSIGRPGWVLDGIVLDLPASQNPSTGHQH